MWFESFEEKGLIEKKKEGKTQTSGRKWDRGTITLPVYSIRDQEGVGHVCVESFPLVKGFRIAGGWAERRGGGGRLNWRADCGSSRERFRASQPQSSSELPFGARRLLT